MESCEREHAELRHSNTTITAAVLGMERDVAALRRLVEALANALRDGAITFAGHDKAQADLRGILLSEIDAVRATLTDLADDLIALKRLQDEARDAHEEFSAAVESINRIHELLEEVAGITTTRTPPPLLVGFQEVKELVRELAERDPESGKPLEGGALLWPRLRQGFLTALAAAILALAYRFLGPYFQKS